MKQVYFYLSLLACSMFANVANAQCTAVQTFSEDFSSYAVQTTFPTNCWGFVKDPGSISGSAYVSEDYSVTPPNKVLTLMGSSGTPGGRYLISPALSTINGNYQLKFDAKLMSQLGAGSTLEVGTLDSQTSVANFSPVGTALSLTTTDNTFTIPVPASATHQYVAIKLNPGGNISAILLDNIIWELASTSVQSVDVTTLNNVPATITTANGTLQLEAVVLPSSVSQNVTWSVQSGSTFASVDNIGLVTAIANGTAVIRATSVADPTQYGEISVVINTTTSCASVSSFYEDFDAPSLTCCNMGVVPGCWNSISTAAGANQIISTTSPASGTNNIYQFGYGANLQSIVVMPEVNNINAGTHQFRFKLRANSGPGDLDFGYITDITNASTFVIIQTINVTNSSYTDPTAERILTVPTTVPSNARLAIRNPGTSWAGFYWDDAYWEPIASTSVQSVDVTTLNNVPATITTANGTLQLEAAVLPSSVSQNVIWSVQSGSTFASVDTTGLITAIATGTVVIRATSVADPTVYGDLSITINIPANSSCVAVQTFSEDFTNFTTFPENCWTGNLPNPPFISITSNKTVQLYSGGQSDDIIIVSPEVSTIDGQHGLVFDIISITQGTTIQIGTMTDNTDFSTFSAIGNSFTPVTGTYTTQAIASNPGHKYVAVKFIHGGGHGKVLELDNFEWTSALSTPKFNTDKVTIYPNPGTGVFYLDTEIDIKSVEVYTTLGQRILITNQKQINMENAASGLYIVNVNATDGTQASYKIIKK